MMRHFIVSLVASVMLSPAALAQARVVSAPAEPSLLNLTSAWGRASTLGELREMRTPDDYLELRVWRGFGLAETQAIVLRRSAGHWSASLARVIRCEIQIPKAVADTASAATMRGFVAQARRQCGEPVGEIGAGARVLTADTVFVQSLAVPEDEIAVAWTDAVRARVLELPPRVHRDSKIDDDITYVIELRRGGEYRASEIEHVERPENETDKQVAEIYTALRRLVTR